MQPAATLPTPLQEVWSDQTVGGSDRESGGWALESGQHQRQRKQHGIMAYHNM